MTIVRMTFLECEGPGGVAGMCGELFDRDLVTSAPNLRKLARAEGWRCVRTVQGPKDGNYNHANQIVWRDCCPICVERRLAGS